MTALRDLYAKLCREQAQAEHSTQVHPAREARRLEGAPAAAFRALSAHAEELRPGFDAALGDAKHGKTLGTIAGELFSTSRQLVFDRLIAADRSYRGTLLGITHGVDCARLLRHVAERAGEPAMVAWCDQMLRERMPLLRAAEDALEWFAISAARE